MLRATVVALAALSLAACASVPNALDAQTRQAMFVKDATIAWTAPDPKEPKPEFISARDEFKTKLESAVEQAFQGSPAARSRCASTSASSATAASAPPWAT
jgi:hypothetical protein